MEIGGGNGGDGLREWISFGERGMSPAMTALIEGRASTTCGKERWLISPMDVRAGFA